MPSVPVPETIAEAAELVGADATRLLTALEPWELLPREMRDLCVSLTVRLAAMAVCLDAGVTS